MVVTSTEQVADTCKYKKAIVKLLMAVTKEEHSESTVGYFKTIIHLI